MPKTSATPKVSVIVPVYNVELYLEQCLASLVGQSLIGIEIIVVNDGSPDGSQAIIDKYVEKCPELIRAFVKENGGLSDARNYGIDRARGEYLAFVDSDDYVKTNMFEMMYEKASQTDSDIVVCAYNKVYNIGWVTKVAIQNADCFGVSAGQFKELLISGKSYAWNKIYRRSFFVASRIRYPKGQHFEDSAVTYNLMLLANHIELVNRPLYCYRCKRKGAITTSVNQKIFDIFDSCNSIIGFFKSCNAFEDFFKEVEYLCIIHIFARIRSLVNCNDKKLVACFIDTAFDFLNTHFADWRRNIYYERRQQQRLKNSPGPYTRLRDQQDDLKTYLSKGKIKYVYELFPFIQRKLRTGYQRIVKKQSTL